MTVYNTATLTSVQDCDAILQKAQHDKAELELKKSKSTSRETNAQSEHDLFQQELDEIQPKIATLTAEVDSLPNGVEKLDKTAELRDLQARESRVQRELISVTGGVVLMRQHNQANWDLLIAEKVILISAVQARKTELGG